MRIVVALGGNALLRRGQPMNAANQLANVQRAAAQIALIAEGNELVVTHGNGPQVGLLALQSAKSAEAGFPLDVLGAETEGMVGYLLEQELNNVLPGRTVVTLLTRTEVSEDDPAFSLPTKPIGPVYTRVESERVASAMHWTMVADGPAFRRVVPSPKPRRVLSVQPIEWLLGHGALVIAVGGGGIPVAQARGGGTKLHGVEAVIDKDAASSMLARQLFADCLLIATDVEAVFLDFGLKTQRAVTGAAPSAFSRSSFAAGSMAPKVEAACEFVEATGRRAAIGSLEHIDGMLLGNAGTQITTDGAHVL